MPFPIGKGIFFEFQFPVFYKKQVNLSQLKLIQINFS